MSGFLNLDTLDQPDPAAILSICMRLFGNVFWRIEEEEPPSVYLMAITNLQWKKPASQDQATDSKTI
jgi:hypothetical protein